VMPGRCQFGRVRVVMIPGKHRSDTKAGTRVSSRTPRGIVPTGWRRN
jgi:hypothetical protein